MKLVYVFPVPSIADSLDDGKFVLLKKSDGAELDYSISNKRPTSRRGKKSRKTSVVSQFHFDKTYVALVSVKTEFSLG